LTEPRKINPSMVPWETKLSLVKQKQQKFLNTDTTSTMKGKSPQANTSKTRKFANFGMSFEKQG